MKKLLILAGAACTAISQWFGGFDSAICTLAIFMVLDYATGVCCAAVFKTSPKSKDGKLESRAGLKGIFRKFGMLILVLVGARLDIMLDVNLVKDCVIFTLCANELISITENLGIMGVPLPPIIKKAISILNEKGEGNDKK